MGNLEGGLYKVGGTWEIVICGVSERLTVQYVGSSTKCM